MHRRFPGVQAYRLVSLAAQLFNGNVPALAANGPISNLSEYDAIAARFAA